MMIRKLSNVAALPLLLCLSTFGHASAGRLGSSVAFVGSKNTHRHQQLNRRLVDATTTTPKATLQLLGDNGNPNGTFPLAKCAGDCDSDRDCSGDLRCYFRRYAEDATPPGCEGEAVDGTDFCFDPADDPLIPPMGTLYRIGQDGDPSWAFPLRKCWGDCDGDEDCLDGLECFKRNQGNQTNLRPPGCIGEGVGTADFCYDPADAMVSSSTDVVLDDETRTVGDNESGYANDETQGKSIEKEGGGGISNGAVTAIVIVVVVLVLLVGGYWFYSRRSANETENHTPLEEAGGPEIKEHPATSSDKAHETDESVNTENIATSSDKAHETDESVNTENIS